MQYLSIDSIKKTKQPNQQAHLRPQSDTSLLNGDIKSLAGSLKTELNAKKSERDLILSRLQQAQNSKSAISEQDQCRNFRQQVKELHQQGSVDSEQLQAVKEDYKNFLNEKNLDENPYLKPFIAFMDEQIHELQAKTKVKFTPKQAFAMYETKNQALAVMDIAGASLNIEQLSLCELSKISKMLTKMRKGFRQQATKLYPELAKVFHKIDNKVSQNIDPQKAKLDFEFAKKPLNMANQIVAITTGNVASLSVAKLDLKKSIVSYYDQVSNLDEEFKKRSVGSTDAD
jgi:hypothetical protein